MKTRNAKKSADNISDAQFEEAIARYADAEKRAADINKSIEADVNEVLEKYEDELQSLTQGKQIAFDKVQAYCVNNKERLFINRRSIGTLRGTAGFRLGNPRLKTARGSNWEQVMKILKEKLPDYIRTSEEPAKDLLLAHRNDEKVAPVLVELGIQVVQDELFYLEIRNAA